MRSVIFFVVLTVFSAGCASKGHIPQYILTDSQGVRQEAHRSQDPTILESSQ